jgi:hypothetical protein
MRKFLLLFLLTPVVLSAQIITTVAGNGVQGYAGDGGGATAAALDRPSAVAFNKAGDMFIVDGYGTRIRKVSVSGIITSVAGDGLLGSSGDGGPASAARVRPLSLATDTSGNLYIGEYGRIRKVDVAGIITTIAGDDTAGYNGDGIPATAARVLEVYLGFVDEDGALWFSDRGNHRIRKIDNVGFISSVAGEGTNGSSGDGGPATAATMGGPMFLSRNMDGELFIPDIYARRTRKISASGIIDAYAGYGAGGSTGGDGGPALVAAVAACTSVACDDSGNVYMAMSSADVIRKVDAAGIISTVAGTSQGFGGDGGPALSAQMNNVNHIAIYNGNLYFTDTYNNRIRRIGLKDPAPVQLTQTTVIEATLYPNPAVDLVIIDATREVETIEVRNVAGAAVPVTVNGLHTRKTTMDIRHLNPGIYYVIMNGAEAGSFLKK